MTAHYATARNLRDPFVFFNAPTGDWRMVLARTCDWNHWQADQRSELVLLRSDLGFDDWEQVGTIGPWSDEGILWEVPLLLACGADHVLIVSIVDRRDGRAMSSVRYWFGRFDGRSFERHDGEPSDGRLLDLGPDFYAAMTSSSGASPEAGLLLVGWLGNWQTARGMDWPGFFGGPISMPRMLAVDAPNRRLRQRPPHELRRAFVAPSERPSLAGLATAVGLDKRLTLRVESELGMVVISQDGPMLTVERSGSELLEWKTQHRLAGPSDGIALFFDGPALELFLEPGGQCCSIALPNGNKPFAFHLESAGVKRPLAFSGLL